MVLLYRVITVGRLIQKSTYSFGSLPALNHVVPSCEKRIPCQVFLMYRSGRVSLAAYAWVLCCRSLAFVTLCGPMEKL